MVGCTGEYAFVAHTLGCVALAGADGKGVL